MIGPLVCAVRIRRERDVRACEDTAHRSGWYYVPTRPHLDFHSTIPFAQRLFDRASQRLRPAVFRNAEGYAALNRRGRRDAESFRPERRHARPTAVCFEVPRGGLEAGPGESIPADPRQERGIDCFRTFERPANDPREQDALEQISRARQRLARIERQLEGWRF